MHLYAAETAWNDFFAIGGFVVGVVGFAATLWQLRETKRAARAAEEAAKKTLRESKDSYERFVASFASRLVSELQSAVDSKDWKTASIRANDIAELLATLSKTGASAGIIAIDESVTQLRGFGQKFAEMFTGKMKQLQPKVAKDKWKPLLMQLHSQLDRLRKPFKESDHEQHSANDTTGNISADRREPSRQDQARPCELDPTDRANQE